MIGAWARKWASAGAHPAVALLATGCVAVTINVTFPQEKIDSAASSIEDLVRSPDAPPPPKEGSRGDAGTATVAVRWRDVVGPGVAEAQVPELKTRTPEVMAVIESRRVRYPALAAALTAGCLGENNQGLVEPRPGAGCPPDTAALASAENHDRLALYRTLVEQNQMPPGDIVRVQAAFARANRDRAPAGAWVQSDAGQWTRK